MATERSPDAAGRERHCRDLRKVSPSPHSPPRQEGWQAIFWLVKNRQLLPNHRIWMPSGHDASNKRWTARHCRWLGTLRLPLHRPEGGGKNFFLLPGGKPGGAVRGNPRLGRKLSRSRDPHSHPLQDAIYLALSAASPDHHPAAWFRSSTGSNLRPQAGSRCPHAPFHATEKEMRGRAI